MEFEKSSIERLKRTLYSRNEDIVPKEKRTPVSERPIDIPTNWGDKSSYEITDNTMTKTKNSFFNKFLIGSFVFFIIALAIALFIFFGGMNMISSNNLDIKIVAPSSISSGEELLVGLSIINNNRTDLEQATLFIDYPDGVMSVGENKVLTRDKVDLGTISNGTSKNHSIRVILSGEKETIKQFKLRIEYKVKGSSAVFSKEKTYDVIISSSPIILEVSYPKEINSGQELTLSIDVISNSSVVMKNSLVKIEYPYGFTYKESNIKPVRNDSVWNVGDLKNGDKKTLKVTGVLVGQNLEDRSFSISAGTQKSSSDVDFDVTLATNIATIGIRKSLFDLNIVSNSNPAVGRQIPVNIKWQNILPDKVLNTQIVTTLSGNVFDRSNVKVGNGGFYRSVDSTILWDKNTTANLASIFPGDFGEVSFSVSSISDLFQFRSIKNPHIIISVKSTGTRSGTDTEEISSEQKYTIKYPSLVVISSKTLRSMGPFSNTGPIPPQADKETTYTITWTLTNANNDLKNSIVTAVLPVGVEWKNEISPLNERLTYDSETRIVTWNVGNVSYGVGFIYSPREVSFKVGITPSVNQIGSTPNLLSRASLVTLDTYTETQITTESQIINTVFSDPTYKGNDDIVVK